MDITNFFEAQDYNAIMGEYIIHSALDLALSNFKSKVDKQEEERQRETSKKQKNIFDIHADQATVENRIFVSLIQTYNYTKDISFKDLDTPKSIVDAFVDPSFFAAQRRSQVENNYPSRKSMIDVFHNCLNNLVILGDLGAGKTTLVKKLCQSIFLKDSKYYNGLNFPILIRLREINNFNSEIKSLVLVEFLLNKMGFILRDYNKEELKKKQQQPNSYVTNLKKYICEFFEDINILILLDGFDEVNDLEVRNVILDDLETLSNSFVKSKILITSRTAEFNYSVSNTRTFEIAPLDDLQIDIFIDQYIVNVEEAKKFKSELLASPYFDTSRKPLALAHLCAIYERYRRLPPKPKSVYKKIVNLYIEEWDAQRRIDRTKKGAFVSDYNNLSNDRKFEFLTKFAYLLTTEFGTSTIFDERQILKCYEVLHEEFDLPLKQAKLIVQEIEGHSGLILQSSNETFEFSHKSIHEYLTAEYISRMGSFPRRKNLLVKIPNELAIATALSSEPNQFMFRLFVKYIKGSIRNTSFANAYFSRLNLEKPDYRLEPILGFLLAYIYTASYFDDVNTISNKTFSKIPEDLKKTNQLLQKFIATNPKVKKSIKLFLEFYVASPTYSFGVDNTQNQEMTRIQKLIDIPNYKSTDQPVNLVVPRFFL